MKATFLGVEGRFVRLRLEPGWLGRLFGQEARTVYLMSGTLENGYPAWILTSGRRASEEMLDAIEQAAVRGRDE